MNDFMVMGRDGLALQHDARSTENLNVTDLDALVDYLRRQRGPLQPPVGARLVTTGR